MVLSKILNALLLQATFMLFISSVCTKISCSTEDSHLCSENAVGPDSHQDFQPVISSMNPQTSEAQLYSLNNLPQSKKKQYFKKSIQQGQRQKRAQPTCQPISLTYPFPLINETLAGLGMSVDHVVCMEAVCVEDKMSKAIFQQLCDDITSLPLTHLNILCEQGLKLLSPSNCSAPTECLADVINSHNANSTVKLAKFCHAKNAICEISRSENLGNRSASTQVDGFIKLGQYVINTTDGDCEPEEGSTQASIDSCSLISKQPQTIALVKRLVYSTNKYLQQLKAFNVIHDLIKAVLKLATSLSMSNSRMLGSKGTPSNTEGKSFAKISLEQIASTICYTFNPKCMNRRVIPLCPTTCRLVNELLTVSKMFVNNNTVTGLSGLTELLRQVCQLGTPHIPCYFIEPPRNVCAGSVSQREPLKSAYLTTTSGNQMAVSQAAYQDNFCFNLHCKEPFVAAPKSLDRLAKSSTILLRVIHSVAMLSFRQYGNHTMLAIDYTGRLPCALSCGYITAVRETEVRLIYIVQFVALLLLMLFGLLLIHRVARCRPLTHPSIVTLNFAVLLSLLPWMISAIMAYITRDSEINCRSDKASRAGKADFKCPLCGLSAALDSFCTFLPDLLIFSICWTRVWVAKDIQLGRLPTLLMKQQRHRIFRAHTVFALLLSFIFAYVPLVSDPSIKPSMGGPKRYCFFKTYTVSSSSGKSVFFIMTSLSLAYALAILFLGGKIQPRFLRWPSGISRSEIFTENIEVTEASTNISGLVPLHKRLIRCTNVYLTCMVLSFFLKMMIGMTIRNIDKKKLGMNIGAFQWCSVTHCDQSKCPDYPRDFLNSNLLMFAEFYIRLFVNLTMMVWVVKVGDPDAPDQSDSEEQEMPYIASNDAIVNEGASMVDETDMAETCAVKEVNSGKKEMVYSVAETEPPPRYGDVGTFNEHKSP